MTGTLRVKGMTTWQCYIQNTVIMKLYSYNQRILTYLFFPRKYSIKPMHYLQQKLLNFLVSLKKQKFGIPKTYRSLWQIHGFEDKTHWWRHLDNFSTHQTQFLVIVQHSVHILNPQGINRAIKNDPLSVWCVCWRKFSEGVSHNTICPLWKITEVRFRLIKEKYNKIKFFWTKISFI